MDDKQKPGAKRPGEDYSVGYGKPPKHARFKPGRSGNPKGRPRGTRNFATDVKAVLGSKVKVTRDGRPRKISTQEAMLLRIVEKALGGDVRVLALMSDLAQTHNNEVLARTAELSAGDNALLELYLDRTRRGAAGPENSQKTASETSKDQTADRLSAFDGPDDGDELKSPGGSATGNAPGQKPEDPD